jgi:hypothetical protein
VVQGRLLQGNARDIIACNKGGLIKMEEAMMTDHQMDAIFELIINLLESNKDDVEKVIKLLKEIKKKSKEERE